MAGHVPRRLLKQPDIDKCLLAGTKLFKWEEGEGNLVKMVFQTDPEGFFLYAKGDDKGKNYESSIWDFSQISDVRPGKPPRDSKVTGFLGKAGSDESIDTCLTLVYRREGIVGLDYINLIADSPAIADRFKKAVNALTANMLHAHAAPCRFLHKHYIKVKLHANGRGEIMLRDVNKLMMIRYAPDNFINQWLGTFNIVKESVDGANKYVMVADFTEDIFLKMFDQILNNRAQDLDVVFGLMQGKSHKSKGQMTKDDFHKFLNADQRDPRLNEILHPYTSKEHASKLISRHEKGRRGDRLTSKGLLEYLLSDDNNVLDTDHLNQTHDMTQSLSHYFINSSHNTYLTGHQLHGKSTVEMYIQTLLLGCRCVELDCWPENDDIIITHGGTLTTKIYFKDVVEAINEFAFVTSEYPVILSIENHCKSKPKLIERMATIFKVTFGDQLLAEPFEDAPLEPGVPLPSPERLKRKILLKDKIKRGKAGSSADFGTLPRGTSAAAQVPATVNEEPEPEENCNSQTEDGGNKTPSSTTSEVTELPAVTVPPANNTTGNTESTDNETSTADDKPASEDAKEDSKQEPDSANDVETKPNDDDQGASQTSESNSPQTTRMIGQRLSMKSQGSVDAADISEINLALVPRPSEVEALVGASPLRELLNYCTGITFEGFMAAEKLDCSFYMSSFADEKNASYIHSQPKEYVRYNIRQLSRVYPEGKRIASTNYMPQGHWDVGCQLVALNFQMPDLPMQLNNAKFEFNGNTGYILKPWVLRSERAQFSPFVMRKLEDIVPAKISVKIISGYFLSDKKGSNCQVEVETYGLFADTIRRKFYTRKMPAPHPHWNEDPFTFKQILLPELAMLRIAVYNDDHEIVGQRSLPVNAMRPGFRHIPLRDKHNVPLPLAMLFVHIKVEDWVPQDMGDLVAMLMDPIAYASDALKAMSAGLDEESTEQSTTTEPKTTPTTPASSVSEAPCEAPMPVISGTPKHPQLENVKKATSFTSTSSGGTVDIMGGLPAPGSPMSTLPRPDRSDSEIQCVEEAKTRELPPHTTHEDILQHKEYKKAEAKAIKDRGSITKKHEKAMKSLKEKVAKGKGTEEAVKDLQRQQEDELISFDRNSSTKLYEVKRKLMESAHKTELINLSKKIHKSDFDNLNSVILMRLKEDRKALVEEEGIRGDIKKKDTMKDAEDKLVQLGKKARNELVMIHQREVSQMQDIQKTATQSLIKWQAKELADIDAKLQARDDGATL